MADATPAANDPEKIIPLVLERENLVLNQRSFGLDHEPGVRNRRKQATPDLVGRFPHFPADLGDWSWRWTHLPRLDRCRGLGGTTTRPCGAGRS